MKPETVQYRTSASLVHDFQSKLTARSDLFGGKQLGFSALIQFSTIFMSHGVLPLLSSTGHTLLKEFFVIAHKKRANTATSEALEDLTLKPLQKTGPYQGICSPQEGRCTSLAITSTSFSFCFSMCNECNSLSRECGAAPQTCGSDEDMSES